MLFIKIHQNLMSIGSTVFTGILLVTYMDALHVASLYQPTSSLAFLYCSLISTASAPLSLVVYTTKYCVDLHTPTLIYKNRKISWISFCYSIPLNVVRSSSGFLQSLIKRPCCPQPIQQPVRSVSRKFLVSRPVT
jgi:hypothetical protein